MANHVLNALLTCMFLVIVGFIWTMLQANKCHHKWVSYCPVQSVTKQGLVTCHLWRCTRCETERVTEI